MIILILLVYGLALFFVFAYSLTQLQLVLKYRKYSKAAKQRNEIAIQTDFFPKVTIQLPIFNEHYVAERLLDQVAKIDYPAELLEIQLLDDSTDDTKILLQHKTKEWLEKGVNVVHIHREARSGFKAGALAEGLKMASGEFIAIFDADFMPSKDFLKRMMPHFKNTSVGMVQSRWEHLNRNYSKLTALQAFGLDAHFSVEQGGRNYGNHFINFNGTAGIWRKSTIEDAGGWQSDTLTEDLDLSYRAQLKTWKFVFVEEVGAPAELPATMNALKTQQFRWNKGAAECVRKNLGKVLRNRKLTFSTKLNAVFHLMNSSVFIAIFILAVLSLPVLLIKSQHLEYTYLFNLAGLFLLSLPILAIFYWHSLQKNHDNKREALYNFIKLFPLFLSVSMGLSLHNSWAVFEGYIGKKTPFLRTPKFNLSNQKDKKWTDNRYLKRKISPLAFLEIFMAMYFLFGIFLAFYLKDYGLLPFHLMLFFGFSYVAYYSIAHGIKVAK